MTDQDRVQTLINLRRYAEVHKENRDLTTEIGWALNRLKENKTLNENDHQTIAQANQHASLQDPILQEIIKNTPNTSMITQPPLQDLNNSTLDDYFKYFNNLSDTKTAQAEAERGISLTRSTITINGRKKTVLYRNATQAKLTLNDDEKKIIQGHEYDALWCATAAAACKYAKDIRESNGNSLQTFISNLLEIHGESTTPALFSKHVFYEKMRKVYRLLGVYFPEQNLKTISDRLEAERDMILVDDPNHIVATYYKSSTTNEMIYDIEVARTKLSTSQKDFFSAVQNKDHSVLKNYGFHQHLPHWQNEMLFRYAPKILEENAIRPSQMHFLPMAPNFWSRYTVAQTSATTHDIINVAHTHGALSSRDRTLSSDKAKAFQAMQYDQLRANFNLSEKDSISYTNFMQHVPIPGAPDIDAAHHLRISTSDKNQLFSIPLGGFSAAYRFFRPLFELFYPKPFSDIHDDPLLTDTFRLIGSITCISDCHAQGNLIPVDTFLNLDNNNYTEEMKFDLEEAYRFAMKISELQDTYFFADNLRIAGLRIALSSKMHLLKKKLHGIHKVSITHKLDTFGCKSSIDRAKVVLLHATVYAQKERLRRNLWNKDFSSCSKRYAVASKTWETILYSAMSLSKDVLNILCSFFSNKRITDFNAYLSQTIMDQRLPIIDNQLKSISITAKAELIIKRNSLLRERASLINDYIEAETMTMSECARAGHTRTMSQYGGSKCVGGVKLGTLREVTRSLSEHEEHLTSVSNVTSLNHGVANKLGIKDHRPSSNTRALLRFSHPTSDHIDSLRRANPIIGSIQKK